MRPWYWVWNGMLIAGLVLGTACLPGFNSNDSTKSDTEQEPEAIPVEVVELCRGEIEQTLEASTPLEAEREVKVFSRTSNLVTDLLVEEGDRVEKDQLLLRLENDLQQIQLSKAQNNLEKAEQEFERQKSLHADQLISDEVFNNAQFELRQLKLSVEDAQRELDYTEVRAPIAGTITRRLVNLGAQVTPNQHLFDIVDFSSIVARVNLPEQHLTQFAEGQSARVTATSLGEEPLTGYVKRVSPIVDAKTGLVKVTVGFREINKLRPGMYVQVDLVLETHENALLIPKRALVYDGGQQFVFRMNREKKVERVLVEPRLANAEYIEPRDGFEEGDRIVVAGQTGLKDGALVRLPQETTASSPSETSTDPSTHRAAKQGG